MAIQIVTRSTWYSAGFCPLIETVFGENSMKLSFVTIATLLGSVLVLHALPAAAGDVRWSVTVGSPGYHGGYHSPPVSVQPPPVVIYQQEQHGGHHSRRHHGRRSHHEHGYTIYGAPVQAPPVVIYTPAQPDYHQHRWHDGRSHRHQSRSSMKVLRDSHQDRHSHSHDRHRHGEHRR